MPKFEAKSAAEPLGVSLTESEVLELPEPSSERAESRFAASEEGSACYVVSVGADRDPVTRAAQLSEIVALVEHQGGHVVGQELRHLTKPEPRTLLGKGVAREIADRARASGASVLVLDAELSPSQTRNLEDAAGIAIRDREAIILNVFLRHAHTRSAKIQVELAQLEYLRPRIRGLGLDMDQQKGGNKNARGPGETASELMARKLDRRLDELRKAAKRLKMSGQTQRQQRSECQRVAVVGYTNAGKTSLMNALTAEALSARDMPFETLDTTSRCLTRHGGEVVLSDTVGFIRRLPERLLASFESTLSEIHEASLLLVVVDVSDPERELQLQTTLEVLDKLGARELPRLYVFNKLDRLSAAPEPTVLSALSEGNPYVALSAHDVSAVAALGEQLVARARQSQQELTLRVPYEATGVLALIYASCRVVSSEATESGLALRIQGRAPVLARIRKCLDEVNAN